MASLNFTDIADVGGKDRDSGSFLVQVSGRALTARPRGYQGTAIDFFDSLLALCCHPIARDPLHASS